MTPDQIILFVIYIIGIISNIIIFFIQKAEIKKLRNITDHVERYFKIFDVETFEKFVKLKEKGFEQEKDIMMKEISLKVTDEYMAKIGKPSLEKGIEQIKKDMGGRFNEMAWFIVDFLSFLPIEDRNRLIENHFPLNKKIIVDNLKSYDNGVNTVKEKSKKTPKQ